MANVGMPFVDSETVEPAVATPELGFKFCVVIVPDAVSSGVIVAARPTASTDCWRQGNVASACVKFVPPMSPMMKPLTVNVEANTVPAVVVAFAILKLSVLTVGTQAATPTGKRDS